MTAPRRERRLTVQGWQYLVLSVMGVLVLAGAVACAVLLNRTDEVEFKDLSKLDFVGMYPNFADAKRAWRAKAQATVDNAQMRYFVVHIHRLMEPEGED